MLGVRRRLGLITKRGLGARLSRVTVKCYGRPSEQVSEAHEERTSRRGSGTTTNAGHQACADLRQLWCGIYVRPKQRKMVLKELPRVRAGYGATFASRLRSSR